MEKHELLSILYSERQRLAAKYTSPGWNYWVLLGALVSSILYFLDLDPINKFELNNVLSAIVLLIFCFVIPIYSYMLFVKKKNEFKEGKLIDVSKSLKKYINITVLVCSIILLSLFVCIGIFKIDIYSFKYPILTLVIFGLIYIICIYGTINTLFYKFRFGFVFGSLLFVSILSIAKIFLNYYAENWTGIEFKFSVIIIVVITIIFYLFNLSKNDLSSIDTLIDNTLSSDTLDSESTLKLLKIITIDYSIKSIFDERIKYLITVKSNIDIQLKEIDDLLSNFKEIVDADTDNVELMNKVNDKCKKGSDFVFSYVNEIKAISDSIISVSTYIQKDNKKKKQLDEIVEILSSIAMEASITMELAVDKHAKLAEILALQNKKLNSRKRRLFNKNIKLKKLLETCSRCEHNLLNSKTNLE